MKYLFSFVLLFLSLFSISQTNSFDKGGGDYYKLRTAVTALQFIEKGKPEKIKPYLSDEIMFESKKISLISKAHPFEERVSPPFFNNPNSQKLWYERTYYKRKKDKVKYEFQVYMELKEIEKKILITKLEIREKGEIIPRKNEIDKLHNADRNAPPPAPPAPPAMN